MPLSIPTLTHGEFRGFSLKSRQVVLVPQMSPVRRLEDLKGLLVATTHDSKAENLLLSQKRLPFSVEVYVEPDDRSL